MKLTRWIMFALLLILWSVTSIVMAQGGVITYGETRSETLSDAAPQVLYSLNGTQDEIVTIYVLSWDDAFQPSVTILGPTGQLAFTVSDGLSPIMNDARVTVKLPQTGSYSILVGSSNSVFGSFTIGVRLTTPGISTQLGAEPVTLDIPPGGQSQAFTIVTSPDADTPITIGSGTQGFIFSGYLSAPDGRVVLAFDGALSSVNAVLPASAEPYILVVRASNPTEGGTLTIAQSSSVPSSSGLPEPVAPENVGTSGTPPSDQCAAIAGASGINIRSGPGTNYGTIGGLAPNAFIIVTGQNSGWYTGSTIYGQGWVAGSVVTLSGPCNNLPFVDAGPPPATTEEPLATDSPIVQATPTATLAGPTATLDINNVTPTATATQAEPVATEEVELAPIDNDQLNMEVDRDAGGQYTNTVSFPDGDTTDRIRITIGNLTNQTPNNFRQMNILVTCFGEGAGDLRWGTGGPSSPSSNGCNQSLTATHTNDSNQTFLNINQTGPGYVTYTVIVTITS